MTATTCFKISLVYKVLVLVVTYLLLSIECANVQADDRRRMGLIHTQLHMLTLYTTKCNSIRS